MKNTIKNSIVTFDFDGCISDYFGGEINPRKSQIKDWIKRLIRRGYDIHIVTRRFGPYASSRGDGNERMYLFLLLQTLQVFLMKTFTLQIEIGSMEQQINSNLQFILMMI